jgi:hypothetical protein
MRLRLCGIYLIPKIETGTYCHLYGLAGLLRLGSWEHVIRNKQRHFLARQSARSTGGSMGFWWSRRFNTKRMRWR